MTDERFALAAEQWMDTIFRVAYSYTRSREDADDVTQDVLLQLYRTEKDFRADSLHNQPLQDSLPLTLAAA